MQEDLIALETKYKFIVNAYGEMMTLINRDYIYELVNDFTMMKVSFVY